MIYKEEKRDLFTVDDSYEFAHCISADKKMGAGIALEFRKRYPKMMEFLKDREVRVGFHILYAVSDFREPPNGVYNLVTKENYWDKPTYESLTYSLISMKQSMLRWDRKKVAMPRIGSGLDKLEWSVVKDIIFDVFEDTDIEILVCYI